MHLARTCGDIAHFRIGRQHVFLLNHPDQIKEVLVTAQANFLKARAPSTRRLLGEGLLTSEGDFHRRQRRLIMPAFHRQHIAGYAAVMVSYASELGQQWRAGATVDLRKEMMRLTLRIVSKNLFDVDVAAEAEEIGDALSQARELFHRPVIRHSALLEKLPFLPVARRFENARARLDVIVYRIITERRRNGTDGGDLISLLLSAQDENGDRMSDEQVRDEAITILLAGHDTTTNALTWTWYLLSQHPEVEAKLHAEIDTQLRGRLPSFDDLSRLVYAEMVVSEGLRLFPPAWRIGRRVVADCEVGGYFFPAGSLVLLSQYVTQRDSRYFPEPTRFDPERWTTPAREARPQFSYFPFGGGTRRCIGEQFARTAIILIIATLAATWRTELVPGYKVEIEPLLTLQPKHGMPMTLQRRKTGHS